MEESNIHKPGLYLSEFTVSRKGRDDLKAFDQGTCIARHVSSQEEETVMFMVTHLEGDETACCRFMDPNPDMYFLRLTELETR